MSNDTSKASGTSKRKAGSKKGGAPKSKTNENEPVSLVRQPELGMNPRAILTGFYGPRGERIRHTVHDGALRMPQEALDLIEDAAAETGISASKSYVLPGLESVVRPCIDPNLRDITVTELSLEKVAVAQQPEQSPDMMVPPPQPSIVHVVRTRAENRTIHRRVLTAAERIRGGGGEDESKMDIDQPSTQAPAETTTASAAPSTGAPLQPSGQTAAMQSQTAGAATASLAAPPPPTTSTVSAQAAPKPSTPAAAPTATPQSTQASTAPVEKSAAPASTSAVPAPTQTTTSAPAPAVAPSTVSSVGAVQSTPTAVTSAKVASVPSAQTLSKKPAPQWEQHKPGPNDEMVTPSDQLSPKPAWYNKDSVADIERTMLPEWFDGSALHRTPEAYISARNKIIAMSDTVANRNVTNSMIRRSIVGDAGSLQRLRNFLVNFTLINEDGINDSSPTPAALREQKQSAPKRFSNEMQDELVLAVVEQSKRRKIDDSTTFVPIDWEEIALQVGHGTTSAECERNFLAAPLPQGGAVPAERSITPDALTEATSGAAKDEKQPVAEGSTEALRQKIIQDLIDGTSPDIIKKVVSAAIESSPNDLKQAQSGAIIGLLASNAVGKARQDEAALSSALSQLVSQRMEKLENRMAMMDDIEGIMEAEKVALELERRDLYTARCRHWFGGA